MTFEDIFFDVRDCLTNYQEVLSTFEGDEDQMYLAADIEESFLSLLDSLVDLQRTIR